jgi:hypothetical protein
MSEKLQQSLADVLYEEGMQYNWRHAESPACAALSRANLERAAAMGHCKALREVAEMVFVGAGGVQNREHALWLKWSAFMRGDVEVLEDLSALLESYAEGLTQTTDVQRASSGARKAAEAKEHLQWLGGYLHELLREKNLNANSEGI